MTRPRRPAVLLFVALAALTARPLAPPITAQAPRSFTLDDILSYPFPDVLTAAPAGNVVAWTFNERGQRNIYVATAPDFTPRRITSYLRDDGQELTSLVFSSDGTRLVYVRGGAHSSNWPAEGNLAPDPAGDAAQPKVQVWSIAVAGGSPVLLGDGDMPAVAPRTHLVAFERDRRIWVAPIDGSKPAEQYFFARGTSQSPV